ncbi:hypothetical protein [Microbacterium tumbae]
MSIDAQTSITLEATDRLRDDEIIRWALSRVESVADESVEIALQTSDDIGKEGYRAESDASRLTVTAADSAGFGYALTEFAARLSAVSGRVSQLPPWSETASPAVPVRGIQRAFVSVQEDSDWFHDRDFWTEYLDHIAAQRFNRFHLSFGMQYNYGADKHGATDNYLCFIYPFLFEVDGYPSVRAEGVDAAERERNLSALKFIARETKRRGMNFQLGLWNHAYDYGRDSRHWYPILGVSAENHAAYSAAAMRRLLTEIPEIDGFTFRVHYEGGIHDLGHEVFWDAVFQAISDGDRVREVDMHAKGVDQALLDAVTKPRIDPVLSGKHWAEHMGLPYHQTTIRSLEAARPMEEGATVKGITEFTRRFTRYGYGDFLGEDRTVDFMYRMWPGTQRLLLWGDPAIASGYGRQATFGEARGIDYCEPLFFKGRKGSGAPGGRDPYVRDDLKLGVHDWRKYRYTYLLWGRLLYEPDADPSVWRRFLVAEYGAQAAPAAEAALANLSRILPLLTSAHGVGASNNGNWPENPVNLPISPWVPSHHYERDTAAPANWSGVIPFDPTLFSSVGDHARDAVAGRADARYTPLEVASWIEGFAERGAAALAEFTAVGGDDPQTARTIIDLEVLVRLGRFYAAQYRAAVDYSLYENSGDAGALVAAVEQAEAARAQWMELIGIVDGVYQDDLRFGPETSEHGHWAQQVQSIDDDLQALRRERDRALQGSESVPAESLPRPTRTREPVAVSHEQPEPYRRGEPVAIRLHASVGSGVVSALLRYRHVDQSQSYEQVAMREIDGGFAAEIPGSYTDSSFPLAYFFEVTTEGRAPTFFPGFSDETLSNQPYYTLRSTGQQ